MVGSNPSGPPGPEHERVDDRPCEDVGAPDRQRHLSAGHVRDAEQLARRLRPPAHGEDAVVETLDTLGTERRERLVPAPYVEQVAQPGHPPPAARVVL